MVDDERRAEDLAIAAAFGQRVKEIRKEKGMTQEQLAEAAGFHPTFISNIERGYRVPSLPTAVRISEGLNTALTVILKDLHLDREN